MAEARRVLCDVDEDGFTDLVGDQALLCNVQSTSYTRAY
jgi:hypothetical protein